MNVFDKVRSVIRDYTNTLDDDYDIQPLLQQAQSVLLTPLRIATSPSAVKAYLGALLFITTSFTLVGVSSSAYLLFYYNFIPRINLEETIYLQYSSGTHPHATIPLQTRALISQQQYDIEVVLHMPRTPTNLGAGNFMVDISLISDTNPASTSAFSYILPNSSLDPSKPPLYRSRRPAILPYSSYLTGLSYSLLHLPSHLLKLRDLDSSKIVVPLFERLAFPRGRQNIPTHAYLEIQSQIPQSSSETCPPQGITLSQGLNMAPPLPLEPLRTLQIYSARLKFRARFRGLRYVVYNYRILSFLVFSTLFYFFAIASMGIAWSIISSYLNEGNATQKKLPTIKQDDSASPTSAGASGKVKSEDDNARRLYDVRPEQEGQDIPSDRSSNDGGLGMQTDTSTTFPGLGRTIRPMRYPGSARATEGGFTPEVEPVQGDDGTNDAEDEEDDDMLQETMHVKDEEDDDGSRGFADSGIGTSMESEQPGAGLVRRRSGRR